MKILELSRDTEPFGFEGNKFVYASSNSCEASNRNS